MHDMTSLLRIARRFTSLAGPVGIDPSKSLLRPYKQVYCNIGVTTTNHTMNRFLVSSRDELMYFNTSY